MQCKVNLFALKYEGKIFVLLSTAKKAKQKIFGGPGFNSALGVMHWNKILINQSLTCNFKIRGGL